MKKFLISIIFLSIITSCRNIERSYDNPEIPLNIQIQADSNAIKCQDTISKFVPLFLKSIDKDNEYLFNIANKKSEFIQKTDVYSFSSPLLLLVTLLLIILICIN